MGGGSKGTDGSIFNNKSHCTERYVAVRMKSEDALKPAHFPDFPVREARGPPGLYREEKLLLV